MAFHSLTPLFDPLVRLLVDERGVKSQLVSQVKPRPRQRILDLGCGTGTLACMLKQACPDAEVVGVDADSRMLEAASAKARAQGMVIQFELGRAESIELGSESFDVVASSLFFHHLDPATKGSTLSRARSWLRAGGELHIADFTRPSTRTKRLLFHALRAFDGLENTRDHAAGVFPEYFERAGFQWVETGRFETFLGTVSTFRASPK